MFGNNTIFSEAAMPQKNYKRTKLACYLSYLGLAPVFSLSPILFVTFNELYGISYTLLGTLVLVNFVCQLTVDLIFSFFSKHFNMDMTVRAMPLFASTGLFIFALVPMLFPEYAYIGLLVGTVIFSAASGLGEVTLSPMIAAIPSKNPEREMSFLHSLYAGSVLLLVTVSSAYLQVFGSEKWFWLAIFWAIVPIFNFVMFCLSPIPDIKPEQSVTTSGGGRRRVGFLLCVACIFFGGATEINMTNWISGYVEKALAVDNKILCDILGMALFAIFLGIGRISYAKFGKNISKVLLVGMSGAAVCYIIAGVSTWPVVSLIACVLTGLCTAMLWPGTLILMEEKYTGIGVAAYAFMAAGGDCGASIAPQLMGAVVDGVAASGFAADLGMKLSMTPDQIGMKAGMLISAIFPILGVAVLLIMKRYFKREKAL